MADRFLKRQYKKHILQCFRTDDGFFVQIKLGKVVIDNTNYRDDEESCFEQAQNIIDDGFLKAKKLAKALGIDKS